MSVTRRPWYLNMPERTPPGVAPANYAYLFTYDDGAGNTKVGVQLHTGGIVQLGPYQVGGGSTPLAEYLNVKRDFGADPTGATDSGQRIVDAITAAQNQGPGSVVYFPYGDYKSNRQLSVPAGVHVKAGRLVGEGNYARVWAGASMASLFELAGGAALSNITADGGGNAQISVNASGNAIAVSHCHIRGGTQYTLRNSGGTNREPWEHLRLSGDGHPTQAVMSIWSTDHRVDSVYADTPGAGAYVFDVNGNTGNFFGLTGDGGGVSKDILVTGLGGSGSQNNFVGCTFKNAGQNADGLISMRGGRNTFAGLSMSGVYGGKAPIAIRAAEGTMIFGCSYEDAAHAASRIVAFMNGSGALDGSPGAVNGTRIYWSSDNCLKVSGEYHNLTNPAAGDGIDIVGYATGGTVGSSNVRT